MNIHGKPVFAHTLQNFLEKEYAFFILYEGGIELRVAHSKGIWYFMQRRNKEVLHTFSFGDNGDVEADNDLVLAFLKEKLKGRGDELALNATRRFISTIISDALIAMYGDKVAEVEVVQPGRNAMLKEDGSFTLSPEKT